MPSFLPTCPVLQRLALLCTCAGVCLAAETQISVVPQLALGTAGLEPGLAVEWRASSLLPIVLRPEVLLNEDGDIGGGGSVLYELTRGAVLPNRQAIAFGPRIVHHQADDTGWEAGLLATWGYDLDAGRPWRHSVGVLGAVGAQEDRKHDDWDVGLTGGIFYAFRF